MAHFDILPVVKVSKRLYNLDGKMSLSALVSGGKMSRRHLMLKRKVEKEINRWISNGKSALLIYGVRQAGKTYIIRHCLKEAGCNYVEFNLIREPDIVTILENSADTDDLILKLSLYSKQKIIPGETVIFFDEIQKYKELVTKIKFLVEDRRFRYILSGSLLGIEITSLKSAPVGFLHSLQMYPLDFEEFLWFFNVDTGILDLLKKSCLNLTPVDNAIHKKMLRLFNLYLIIGGMPAAVEKYRQEENIDAVMEEHRAILQQYKLDFTQYESTNRKLLLTTIYDLIPAELNTQNKRFKFSDIDKNLRFDKISESFIWLWKAGVALPVFNTTEPSIPLMINQKSSLFKLFMSDVGMLTTIYGKAAKLKILNHDSDINNGSVYENIAVQELTAHGYNCYYYNSKKYGELDFLIEHDGTVLPIEIKSGKNYKRHSALSHVLESSNYNLNQAVVFSNSNVESCGRIAYLPIYMLMFLEEASFEFADISMDKFKL